MLNWFSRRGFHETLAQKLIPEWVKNHVLPTEHNQLLVLDDSSTVDYERHPVFIVYNPCAEDSGDREKEIRAGSSVLFWGFYIHFDGNKPVVVKLNDPNAVIQFLDANPPMFAARPEYPDTHTGIGE